MAESCPKCGATQIQHDQCLKCGVIISKARAGAPRDGAARKDGVSFVAPGQQLPPLIQGSSNPQANPAYNWRPATMPAGPIVFSEPKKFNNLKTNLVFAAILLLVIFGGYKIYRYFVHQASAFSGHYRSTDHVFALLFPDNGWNHYHKSELKDDRFKDAVDAFYKGSDPEDPKVLMAVWTEPVSNPIPASLDDRTSASLLRAIQSELVRRMEKSKLQCDITHSRKTTIAGRDGFLINADLEGRRGNLRTIIYCAFDTGRAVTVQFIGKDTELIEAEKEIESMMGTFGFDIRLF